jgi:peptide/nickel transport system permease protein
MPEPVVTTTEPPDRAGTAPAGRPSATPVEREFTVKERGQLQMAMMRFLRHRLAVASLGVFLALVLFAFVGPLLWPRDHTFLKGPINGSPSAQYPFGTDNLGHDVFAQVMRGMQQSIKVALLVAVLATVVGTVWGVVAGYLGRWVDAFLMRFADLILTIPGIALAAAMSNRFKGGWWVIALILGSLSAPYVSRVVRGVVLSLREREFTEASRALGASNTWIMFRHLVPNAFAVVIVIATLLVAGAILAEAGLSFFGFGINPPDISLGYLVSAGQQAVFTRPWLFYFPGLFIIIIALAVNFVGDGLRDALDPKQTRERR